MRGSVIGGLLAAALLAGCGGVEVEETDNLATQGEDLAGGSVCPAEETWIYYSDATHTQQVGAKYCDCLVGKGGWGVVTPYVRYTYYSCPL